MPHTEHDERELLKKLRREDSRGATPPRLYEIFAYNNGTRLTPTKLEWMFYAGMGDYDMAAVSDTVYDAAKSLMRKGDLVRTFEEDLYGLKQICRIECFDDIKFGLDSNNDVIVYDFSPTTALPDPIMRPDYKHRSAIARIKQMINDKSAALDPPIRLTQGEIIRPIIHADMKNLAEICKRQSEFKL